VEATTTAGKAPASAAVETPATSTTAVAATSAAMLGKCRIRYANQSERSNNREKSFQNERFTHFSPSLRKAPAAGVALDAYSSYYSWSLTVSAELSAVTKVDGLCECLGGKVMLGVCRPGGEQPGKFSGDVRGHRRSVAQAAAPGCEIIYRFGKTVAAVLLAPGARCRVQFH
jgi:hypothetical protein